MGKEERREIASYVLGQGLDPQLHGLNEVNVGGVKVIEGPQLGQPGWRGRMVEGIYDVLSEEGERLGLSPAQVKTIKTQERDEFFKRPLWSSVKGFGLSTWQNLSVKAVDR